MTKYWTLQHNVCDRNSFCKVASSFCFNTVAVHQKIRNINEIVFSISSRKVEEKMNSFSKVSDCWYSFLAHRNLEKRASKPDTQTKIDRVLLSKKQPKWKGIRKTFLGTLNFLRHEKNHLWENISGSKNKRILLLAWWQKQTTPLRQQLFFSSSIQSSVNNKQLILVCGISLNPFQQKIGFCSFPSDFNSQCISGGHQNKLFSINFSYGWKSHWFFVARSMEWSHNKTAFRVGFIFGKRYLIFTHKKVSKLEGKNTRSLESSNISKVKVTEKVFSILQTLKYF